MGIDVRVVVDLAIETEQPSSRPGRGREADGEEDVRVVLAPLPGRRKISFAPQGLGTR